MAVGVEAVMVATTPPIVSERLLVPKLLVAPTGMPNEVPVKVIVAPPLVEPPLELDKLVSTGEANVYV